MPGQCVAHGALEQPRLDRIPAAPPRSRLPAATAPARSAPSPPEGKARSSRNALKHGLAALHHLVLEDEAPSELEELTARLLAECAPDNEIEARLVKRMAIAFWKSERAERIEVALFDAAPKLRPPQAGFAWEQADPLTTFDLKRFNAVRGYQAQQGRELSRCLKELRSCAASRSRRARANPSARHRTNPCLTRVWQKGVAPTPCRGWVRGVGDRNEPRVRARGLA